MSKRIQSIFNIHPGEGRMVTLVLAYAIMLYASNMMARTASMALFFGEYDAATLPYTYLFLMVIGPLVSFIYLRFNNRYALSKVLLGVHGFLLVTLIFLPLILGRLSAPYLLFSLPVYFGVNNSLTISSFWNLLGRIYNLRQGKRLFSLLSSGEHMATIVAGFMAPLFVARIGTSNLYWIGALCMVAAIALLFVINRQNSEKMDSAVGGKRERRPESGLMELLKEPYVRLIFALFALFIIGIYMVGNIAYSQAEIRFPTADAMAVYIGVFMGIFGVLSLIVQWVLAGRILDRFGVRSMILATPGGLFLFMSLFAIVGTLTDWTSALFWLAASASMYQAILDAVDSAAINIMYQPLPAHLRTQAQTSVIGVVYPLATGIAGLLMIFFLDGLGFDSVQLSYATLVVIAIWLVVGIRLGRAYPRRLRQALQERSLSGLAALQPDQSGVAVLEEALESAYPAAVLYALDMLDEVAPQRVPVHLPSLLAYPDKAVRIAALERIAALPWKITPPGVPMLLENGADSEVRAAALKTWYAINPREATPSLSSCSRDRQADVQQAALAIMRLHAGTAVRDQAIDRLNDLAASTDPQERIVAAAVIGETAEPADVTLLLSLLGDGDSTVRYAALQAAARARFPDTWPAVLPALTESKTRAPAVFALAAGGEETLPLLEEACKAPDADPRLLAGIAAVCGRLGGPRAQAILLQQITNPDSTVRHQALSALALGDFQAYAQDSETIAAQLSLEAQRSAQLVAAQVDVGSKEQVRLAADSLDQARQLLADNLLLLLSFLYDAQTVLSVREALHPRGSAAEERSAYAIEVLDILLDQEHKRLLLPFFQELSPQQRLAVLAGRHQQELLGREQRLLSLLGPLSGEMERWIGICALYALGLLGDDEAIEPIVGTAVRHNDDALLLETALNSLEQLAAPLDTIAAHNPSLQPAIDLWRRLDRRAMTVLQKTEILKQVSIFSHLPNELLHTVAHLMVDGYVQPGQTIIRKGETGHHLYVVVDGHLRVHDGDHTLDTLGAGGVAGEMALLDDQARSASVTAVADSHLLQLDQNAFYELLAGQPQLLRDMMSLLSRRLREQTRALPPGEQEQPARPVLPLVGGQPGMTSVAVQGHLMDLDKVFVLKRVELFGESDNELLGRLASLLEEVDLAGGEELFHQGDLGQSLYIVAAGQVRVHIDDRTLAYVGEGEVIGEMALLESEPRLAAVTAVVPTQLLRLDQEPFFELLETQPQLARGIITMLSARLRSRPRTKSAAAAESTPQRESPV